MAQFPWVRSYVISDGNHPGSLEVLDESMADDFWRCFTDDSMHQFYEPGNKKEGGPLTVPPWE